MKNEILDEINTLRRSQETLTGSKDYTGVSLSDIQRCVNHNNKRVFICLFRLNTDFWLNVKVKRMNKWSTVQSVR